MTTATTTTELRYEALLSYVNREGTARVPVSHVEGDVNLGAWISYVRNRYRKGLLSGEEIARYEKLPGWEWGPLRPGPQANTTRDAEIKRMRNEGLSLQAIGDHYNLSRQRIHQILAAERA